MSHSAEVVSMAVDEQDGKSGENYADKIGESQSRDEHEKYRSVSFQLHSVYGN